MIWNKLFRIIAKICPKHEASVIMGILQAVRDDCPIDYTVEQEMLNLIHKHRKKRTGNYTQVSRELYSFYSDN